MATLLSHRDLEGNATKSSAGGTGGIGTHGEGLRPYQERVTPKRGLPPPRGPSLSPLSWMGPVQAAAREHPSLLHKPQAPPTWERSLAKGQSHPARRCWLVPSQPRRGTARRCPQPGDFGGFPCSGGHQHHHAGLLPPSTSLSLRRGVPSSYEPTRASCPRLGDREGGRKLNARD